MPDHWSSGESEQVQPVLEQVVTEKGKAPLWLSPGSPFPGYGTKWESPGTYLEEHQGWDIPSLSFCLDSSGIVHLRGGLVEMANPYSLWDEDKAEFPGWEDVGAEAAHREAKVFTLPPGARPDGTVTARASVVIIEEGIADKNSYWLTVLPSGLVQMGGTRAPTFGLADDIVIFDGISFPVA